MKFLIVANFKSHKNSQEVKTWLESVIPAYLPFQDKVSLIVAPSYPYLSQASSIIRSTGTQISLASQDVSPFPEGSYTGAVNAGQLVDLQITHAIIGHSERRRYFHETNQEVANKAKLLSEKNITPLICLSKDIISPQFAALDEATLDRALYCFEPPDGLGGNTTADPSEINEVINLIKPHTTKEVLYGGSVTPQNITSLLSLSISGVLVSTAALQPDSIISIISQVAHAR